MNTVRATGKRNLLIVDDEPQIINSLRFLLEKHFSIHSAGSAEEGYRLLDEVPIQVVLTDYMMPGITGVEFLEKVGEKHPDIIRIIITGIADVKMIISAINKGQIFRYISKPWNNMELKTIVREAFERFELQDQNRRLVSDLKAALGELESLNQDLEKRVQERTQQLENANASLVELNGKLKDANQQLERMASTDGLTGVFNRRYFDHTLESEFKRSERYANQLGLLLLDMDNFKIFNDTYGHQVGDRALIELCNIIRVQIRTVDVAARYGGEEFAIILLHTEEQHALLVAERVRKEVHTHLVTNLRKVLDQPFPEMVASVSIGLAMSHEHATNPKELVEAADKALYHAKRTGKNRCVVYDPKIMQDIVGRSQKDVPAS